MADTAMTGSSSQTSSEEGFSILEMIVAMTILALVLGIASQSIVLASRSIAAAKQKARQLCELPAHSSVS